jgi:hypothetical protein
VLANERQQANDGMMNLNDLYLENWEQLPELERAALGQQVARELPGAFRLVDVQQYELGDQRHWVARFRDEQSVWMLIPGGRVTLGYDPEQPYPLSPQQQASWEETAQEYGIEGDFEAWLAGVTTKLRMVTLAPFLLEAHAVEAKGSGAWKSQAEASRQVRAQGLRLPSSDEWEYACSAGARSLFRWGNDCPGDGYPTDERWQHFYHTQPNAFGLKIAHDPYQWEFVAEPEILRGGDGGGMICGGAGFFLGWIPLASAYVDPSGDYWKGKAVPEARVRRALSLD